MPPVSRKRYPDLQGFDVLGNVLNKLSNLPPKDKDRVNDMLAGLHVNWRNVLYETFPRQSHLRGAYENLHKLHKIIAHLANEMTTEPPEIGVDR